MYCKNCGEQISDTAKFCEHCGYATNAEIIPQPKPQAANENQKTENNSSGNTSPKKKSNGLALVVIFLIFFVISGISGQFETDTTEPGETEPTSPIATSTSATVSTTSPTTHSSSIIVLDERAQFIEDAQNAGLSQSAAENIYDLLKSQLLCTEIKFKRKSDVGNALYEIDENRYALKVAADNNGIYSVRCGSYEMFDGETVQYTVHDIALREIGNNDTYYATIAKSIVLGCLKSPDSAKFSPISEMKMQRYGDIVAVSGYVDAQNAFGATIRNEWVVQFSTDHNNLGSFSYQTLYIRIGDQETGEFVEFE